MAARLSALPGTYPDYEVGFTYSRLLLARENLFFLMNISKDLAFIPVMVLMEAKQ